MSEGDAQDKQHKPSSKKLADLRKEGRTLRSRDLSGGLIFIVAIMMLSYMSASYEKDLLGNFTQSYSSIKQVVGDNDFLFIVLRKIVIKNFLLIAPLFAALLVTVFCAPIAFGGWNFSWQAVGIKFSKLNPITNLMNIFSPKRAAVEILKSVLKFTFIMGVLVNYFFLNKHEILILVNYPAKVAIASSYHLVVSFVTWMAGALIFVISFDLIQQFFQYQSQVKMSSQELKDEHKDAEGSGEVKRKMRSAQMQLLKQRMTQSVPKANVIITNPTHYSIALRYDERRDKAPKVVAKGKGALAKQIRNIAITNAIPIYEAPPLARAIYHTTKLNREVHPALYMAVAIVLSYVHQLKSFQMGIGSAPIKTNALEVPEEFIFNE